MQASDDRKHTGGGYLNWKLPDRFKDMAHETICLALLDLNPLRETKDSKVRRLKIREETIAWFKQRSTEPFGYGWCLNLTGYNPNALRKYINLPVDKLQSPTDDIEVMLHGENHEQDHHEMNEGENEL
jgi:hypothetical protein